MSWEQTIKQGMELIIKGCDENGTWSECYRCPFDNYCDTIMDAYGRYVGTAEIFKQELGIEEE